MNSYRELLVWQKALEISKDVYVLSKYLPKNEKFGIGDQIKRASISICSNIAEGWGRELPKSFIQFLRIARGSLYELETQLILVSELKLVPSYQIDSILVKTEENSKMINGLIRSLKESNYKP